MFHFLSWWNKRFAKSETELETLKDEVKQGRCRHCGRFSTLNNHGSLTDKRGTLRGLRFWCSSRRTRAPGCGRSFSVWLCEVIPGHSVRAETLAAFLLTWAKLGGDVLAAWQHTAAGFSTDSAYRWARRFVRNQGEVRRRLCRLRDPPRPLAHFVHADLFEHLHHALESTPFTEAFQIRFQQPWPMKA